MKQHPLCTDTECASEHGPSVLDLPISDGLKNEWAALQTRRHFLGKAGKVLGWAAMASLMGDRAMRSDAQAAKLVAPSAGEALRLPHFAPKAKRAIFLFMSAVRHKWICWTTSPDSPLSMIRTCLIQFEAASGSPA